MKSVKWCYSLNIFHSESQLKWINQIHNDEPESLLQANVTEIQILLKCKEKKKHIHTKACDKDYQLLSASKICKLKTLIYLNSRYKLFIRKQQYLLFPGNILIFCHKNFPLPSD